MALYRILFVGLLLLVPVMAADPVRAEYKTYDDLKADAERGDPESQYQLGLIYYFTTNIKDNSKTLGWMQKSAVQDNPWAQLFLAKMYKDGEGTDVNPKQSLEWLLKAVAQELSGAQLMMGQFYRDGFAVERNNITALMWMTLAEKQGLELAKDEAQELAAGMSPADILSARAMAEDSLSNYINKSSSNEGADVQ